MRQSLASLILLYFQVLPSQGVHTSFDVSTTIAEARMDAFGEGQNLAFPWLEFESCLEIASSPLEMRWWNKLGKHQCFVCKT